MGSRVGPSDKRAILRGRGICRLRALLLQRYSDLNSLQIADTFLRTVRSSGGVKSSRPANPETMQVEDVQGGKVRGKSSGNGRCDLWLHGNQAPARLMEADPDP